MDSFYDYPGIIGAWSAWAIVIWIVAVGAAVGLAFIPATIARNKGYSFGGFWVFGFFFFIIALIVALCLEDKRSQQYRQYQQPYGQQYQPPYQQPYGQSYQQPPPSQYSARFCTSCGSPVAEGSAFCSKCGAKLS